MVYQSMVDTPFYVDTINLGPMVYQRIHLLHRINHGVTLWCSLIHSDKGAGEGCRCSVWALSTAPWTRTMSPDTCDVARYVTA